MTWRPYLDARGALDVGAVAGALRRARRDGQTFDVLLSDEVGLGLADAYRVQDQVLGCRHEIESVDTLIVCWTGGAAA